MQQSLHWMMSFPLFARIVVTEFKIIHAVSQFPSTLEIRRRPIKRLSPILVAEDLTVCLYKLETNKWHIRWDCWFQISLNQLCYKYLQFLCLFYLLFFVSILLNLVQRKISGINLQSSATKCKSETGLGWWFPYTNILIQGAQYGECDSRDKIHMWLFPYKVISKLWV